MSENDQEFENLIRLLKLKQHEVPPPGYFHGFSRQVIGKLREAREPETMTSGWLVSAWVTRFLGIFDSRPGLVGGLATSMMLFLVLGVVLADRSDNEISAGYAMDPVPTGAMPSPGSTGSPGLAMDDQSSSGGISVSTNPVTSLQPSSVIFGQESPLFQMASYSPQAAAGH